MVCNLGLIDDCALFLPALLDPDHRAGATGLAAVLTITATQLPILWIPGGVRLSVALYWRTVLVHLRPLMRRVGEVFTLHVRATPASTQDALELPHGALRNHNFLGLIVHSIQFHKERFALSARTLR